MTLEGRCALITGARRNIGRGIALALAHAGCHVAINDIERDADAETTLYLIRQTGREAEFYTTDISNAEGVNAMIGACVERFGRLDILVNNALGPPPFGYAPFLELKEEDWDRVMAVSLKGYFLCSQAAGRVMIAQGKGGSIVSISSVHATKVYPTDMCYGVIKEGVIRMTQSMAVELSPFGIRCNAIQPGYMDTGHVYGTPPPAIGSAPETHWKALPTRRYGTPEDIGNAVVFLSSPAAGQINGVSIPIDGGLLLTGFPY
ncbi:MAG: SDR family oxidoreductase [candidate division Zixibacteria bacterium]|nr:SDR family oxidoreductase [candidate division Zixibacteria bacterium]